MAGFFYGYNYEREFCIFTRQLFMVTFIRFIAAIFLITFITGCYSADDYMRESNAAADKGDYEKAIELIDKAIKINPKHKGAFLNRGLCHEEFKQFKAAIADYQLNDFRNCFKDFKECWVVNEYRMDSQYMMALCYIESGNKEKGCEELDKCIAMGDTLAMRKKQELCK